MLRFSTENTRKSQHREAAELINNGMSVNGKVWEKLVFYRGKNLSPVLTNDKCFVMFFFCGGWNEIPVAILSRVYDDFRRSTWKFWDELKSHFISSVFNSRRLQTFYAANLMSLFFQFLANLDLLSYRKCWNL